MWWIGPSLCPIRLIGDLSFALSIPVLLWRIIKNDSAGVSFRTQLLHLAIFLTRYLDLFQSLFYPNAWYTLDYNDVMKCYYTLGTALVVFILGLKKFSVLTTPRMITALPELLSYFFVAFALASTFNYDNTKVEILWTFSQYLSIVAEIPQLVTTYKTQKRDVKIYVYLALVASFRFFYFPHWLLLYRDFHAFNPIPTISSAGQLCVLFIGSIILATQSSHQDPVTRSFGKADLLPKYAESFVAAPSNPGEKN